MSKFKIGDKVRCIDAGPSRFITLGATYTIQGVHEANTVALCEVSGINYWEWRFVPIPEPEQPIQQFSRECKCGIHRNDCVYHRE